MTPAPNGLTYPQILINGDWVPSTSDATMAVENPATARTFATVPAGTPADADRAVQAAAAAQPAWAALPAIQRGRILLRWAALIERDADRLAPLVTAEVGKTLAQAHDDLGAAVMFLTWAAESARRIEGEIFPAENPSERIYIHRVPYGVVVALTAWNFPPALFARKAGPALVTGNTVVVKPHELTPVSTLEIARLGVEAGLPPGTLNVVTGAGRVVGEALVAHPLTRLVTMTGSVRAGREIMRTAAENVTMVRLELGGKAPFIVMEDADLDAAVAALVGSRFYNCGQVCTCPERTYVHAAVMDEFMAKLLPAVQAVRVGDPTGEVDMGPKVSAPELEKLEGMVAAAVASGARVATGGGRATGLAGHFYEPTVLTNVTQAMPIMRDEIFGPVLPVMAVADFDEALRLANDTPYGLAAMVFCHDLRRVGRLADELQFGEIYINRGMGESCQGFHNGHKLSGLGGEDGKHGLEGYLQKRTMYVSHG